MSFMEVEYQYALPTDIPKSANRIAGQREPHLLPPPDATTPKASSAAKTAAAKTTGTPPTTS